MPAGSRRRTAAPAPAAQVGAGQRAVQLSLRSKSWRWAVDLVRGRQGQVAARRTAGHCAWLSGSVAHCVATVWPVAQRLTVWPLCGHCAWLSGSRSALNARQRHSLAKASAIHLMKFSSWNRDRPLRSVHAPATSSRSEARAEYCRRSARARRLVTRWCGCTPLQGAALARMRRCRTPALLLRARAGLPLPPRAAGEARAAPRRSDRSRATWQVGAGWLSLVGFDAGQGSARTAAALRGRRALASRLQAVGGQI